MEPIDAIEKLARAGREEAVPETDINVRRLIRAIRPEPTLRLAPLAWSAALSAVAAVVMLSFALHSSGSSSSSVDSISPLFNAAQVQLP
jgi:hypothetical protein